MARTLARTTSAKTEGQMSNRGTCRSNASLLSAVSTRPLGTRARRNRSSAGWRDVDSGPHLHRTIVPYQAQKWMEDEAEVFDGCVVLYDASYQTMHKSDDGAPSPSSLQERGCISDRSSYCSSLLLLSAVDTQPLDTRVMQTRNSAGRLEHVDTGPRFHRAIVPYQAQERMQDEEGFKEGFDIFVTKYDAAYQTTFKSNEGTPLSTAPNSCTGDCGSYCSSSSLTSVTPQYQPINTKCSSRGQGSACEQAESEMELDFNQALNRNGHPNRRQEEDAVFFQGRHTVLRDSTHV